MRWPTAQCCSLILHLQTYFSGTVRLLFQPAEEGGAGGLVMLKEGAMSRPPQVQMVYGQHIWPTLPSGIVASRSGPIFAAAGFFTVTLSGGGGHAAMPHSTNDTVLAAAHCITMLQSIVSRSLDPVTGGGVVSITKMSGGNAYNVIPAGEASTARALLHLTRASSSRVLRRHDQGAEPRAVRAARCMPSRSCGRPLIALVCFLDCL